MRKTTIFIAATLLMAGCYKAELESPINGNPEGRNITIIAGQDESRAYVSEVGANSSTSTGSYSLVWDKGDAIGLYLDGPTTENNCRFTSISERGVSKAHFVGKLLGDETEGNHSYYAYSPYNPNAGVSPTAVAGTLNATQTQTDSEGTHIGKYLFETANAEAPNNNGATLTFTNRFSILNFKVKYRAKGVGGETEDFSGVKVSGVRVFVAEPTNDGSDMHPLFGTDYMLAGNFTADITKEQPTIKFNKDSYSWIVECNLANETVVPGTTDSEAIDVWVVVNPINIGDKKLVAEIVTNRGVFQTSRSIKSNGGQLKANSVYVLPATIKTPKVTPQIYPLWTEEKSPNTFFKTLQLNGEVTEEAEELKPSNCFVVKPNKLYKFKANVCGRGAAGMAAMGVYSDTLIGDYPVKANGSLSTLLKDEDYIYFKTTEAGNAVVTIYFGGTALWSWHIWSITDTLTDVEVAKGVFMLDRNLGAREALTTSLINNAGTFDVRTAGLFYCWGYNIPYPGMYAYLKNRFNRDYNTMAIGQNLYNYYYEGSTPTLVTTRYIVPANTLSTSVLAPYAPADLCSNTEKNPETDSYLRMWGYSEDGNYKKSAFDPCPYGYMVPPVDIFGQFNDKEGINEEGINSATYKVQVISLSYNNNITYLPKIGIVGLLSSDTSSSWRHQNQGQAYLWTATPAEVSENGGQMSTGSYNPDTGAFGSSFVNDCNNRRGMAHYFQSNIHYNFAISRFQGCPVRCIRCPEEQ